MVDGSLAAAYLARWAATGGGRAQVSRADAALFPLADLVRGRLGYHCLDDLLRDPHDQRSRRTLARAIEEEGQQDTGFARQIEAMVYRLPPAADGRGYPSRSSSSGVGWVIVLVVMAVFALSAYLGFAH